MQVDRACLHVDGHAPAAAVVTGLERAGARSLGAGLEVVRPVEVRGAAHGVGQVHVRVHPARRHDAALGLEFPTVGARPHLAAELHDLAVLHSDVHPGAPAGGDGLGIADDQVRFH